MKLDPQRLAAARALLAVDRGERLAVEGALARHLALGVLRVRGWLDAALEGVGRPVDTLDAPVRTALRVGLFELKFSRTPDHAAVDQAVELVKRLKKGRASGYVNAVLRKAGRGELPTDSLLNHPAWLVKRWVERLGEAPTRELCGRLDQAAPLALVGDIGEISARPGPVEASFLLDDAGAVPALPGYDEGGWWVMDPAAAAVADLVPRGRVLDACAAPGGKTLRMLWRGCDVLAVDRSSKALRRLGENLRRCGYSAATRRVDWTEGSPDLGLFDAVLVDAPCTGLGTTRRHPEIRWTRMPTDPIAMGIRQEQILAACARHVRPEGHLVYAVCSPEPEEGPQVAQSLGWPVVKELQTHGQPDMDGHYAALLRRPA